MAAGRSAGTVKHSTKKDVRRDGKPGSGKFGEEQPERPNSRLQTRSSRSSPADSSPDSRSASPSPRTKRLRRAQEDRHGDRGAARGSASPPPRSRRKRDTPPSASPPPPSPSPPPSRRSPPRASPEADHRASKRDRNGNRTQDRESGRDRGHGRGGPSPDRPRGRDEDPERREPRRGHERRGDRDETRRERDRGRERERELRREEERLPPPPPGRPMEGGRQRGEREDGGREGRGRGASRRSRSRDPEEQENPSREDEQGPPRGDAVDAMEEVAKELEAKEQEKVQPSFGLSGKLAEETNKVRGVTLQFVEPPEARKPNTRWRLYVFKDGEPLKEPLYIHRQSCYLFGRERRVADIPTDHPSCSKQHAVLQYRLVQQEGPEFTTKNVVKPYLMDLGSTNGSYLNGERIEPQRYYELMEKDTLKFGNSSREYVLLHEGSTG